MKDEIPPLKYDQLKQNPYKLYRRIMKRIRSEEEKSQSFAPPFWRDSIWRIHARMGFSIPSLGPWYRLLSRADLLADRWHFVREMKKDYPGYSNVRARIGSDREYGECGGEFRG